jgi:glycosyltransferase involved in cell wall biosynthesis
MKVTFITTIYNEEDTIDAFLASLSKQTKLPDEIIITDAGSQDETVSKLKQFQKKSKVPVKIIIKHGNRSIGRNQAIKHASGQIITCSDAGCILDRNWLKSIIKPFTDENIDVVSGFYLAKTENIFQKCLAAYTCVMPDKVDKDNFLPSSRSIAFRKSAWKEIGGYPEELNTCEDLIFATKLKKAGCNFIFAENAIVYWPQRKNLRHAFQQFFSYAVGDGQALFIRRQIPFLFLRYLLAIMLVIEAILTKSQILLILCLTSLVLYICWSIIKNYKYIKNKWAFLYLPVLQFTADAAVLSGTSFGLLSRKNKSTLNSIVGILFGILLVMLFVRSAVFTSRIVKEIKTYAQSPSINTEFMPAIQPCQPRKKQLNAEEQHILNYRALGVKCKK